MFEMIINHRLTISVIVIAVALLIKYFLVKFIRARAKKRKLDKRYLVSHIKNFINFTLVIVLLSFWAHEIQNFALSIAAFAVAIVLATREFIQCIIGFFYLMSTRPFRIGDWIQVGEYTGEVSATDWIKSTLLEVNLKDYRFTGKTLFIPNNKLITSPIKNLNFLKRYVSHHFAITRDEDVNPYLFIDALKEKTKAHCDEFYDVASRYNQIIERRLDVKIHGPEPHIEVVTSEIGHTQIHISIFCPTDRAVEIEQKITKDCLQLWFEELAKVIK